MARLRSLVSACLVVALVLTAQAMAVARAMPTAAGMLELCTGAGPVMVPVDSDGNPTGPAHICPEFGLSLLDAVAAPECAARIFTCESAAVFSQPQVADAWLMAPQARARAPPTLS